MRIPAGRLDTLSKLGIMRDFTSIVMRTEGAGDSPEDVRRVWFTINELEQDDWGIGGHTDWLRSYTSALDEIADRPA